MDMVVAEEVAEEVAGVVVHMRLLHKSYRVDNIYYHNKNQQN